jgi:hypothetical protein
VARAMRQVFDGFADFAQRFLLRLPNDWCDETVFNRNRDGEIDILILHNRVLVERRVHFRNFDRGID